MPISRMTPSEMRLREERRAWSSKFNRCWACGTTRRALETHEIVRRSETAEWSHPCNFTRLCRECHEECHGGDLTKGILLMLKLIFDPLNYDAEWIRNHAIKHHWEPEPLPQRCRWMIAT